MGAGKPIGSQARKAKSESDRESAGSDSDPIPSRPIRIGRFGYFFSTRNRSFYVKKKKKKGKNRKIQEKIKKKIKKVDRTGPGSAESVGNRPIQADSRPIRPIPGRFGPAG